MGDIQSTQILQKQDEGSICEYLLKCQWFFLLKDISRVIFATISVSRKFHKMLETNDFSELEKLLRNSSMRIKT